jgi:hypothetical protein
VCEFLCARRKTGVRRETVSAYDRQRQANPAKTFPGSRADPAKTFAGSRRFTAAAFHDAICEKPARR